MSPASFPPDAYPSDEGWAMRLYRVDDQVAADVLHAAALDIGVAATRVRASTRHYVAFNTRCASDERDLHFVLALFAPDAEMVLSTDETA